MKKNGRLKLFDIAAIGIGIVVFLSLIYILLRPREYVEVTLRVAGDSLFYTEYENPPFWYANRLEKGMNERSTFGSVQAEITNVATYPSLEDLNKKMTIADVKILAVYNKSKQLYTYKSNPIIIGGQLRLELDRQLVNGFVIDIKNPNTQNGEEYKTIKTRLIPEDQSTFKETSGVDPFIAEAVPENEIVYDTRGDKLVEVLKKEVLPALRYTYTDSGKVLAAHDPIKKDVYLTLRIRTEKINNEDYFFYTYKVAVNQRIPIVFKNTFVTPTITEILN